MVAVDNGWQQSACFFGDPMSASHRATVHRSQVLSLASALLLGGLASASVAQTQVVKPPLAQYWMDVATVRVAGLDEMPNMGAMGSGGSRFGATKGMVPGRWLDIAISAQRKPLGPLATQNIPAGLGLGSSLTLLPPEPATTQGGTPPSHDAENGVPEQPKGRILLYWGCSDTVRAGQPKVLDFATAKAEDYAQFMRGRATRERGATAAPDHAVWPNPQYKQLIPKGASLQGEHRITGDGIPASLQFDIGQVQDFMPPLVLTATGGGTSATTVSWPDQPQARGYFLNAMGGSEGETVLWSSAETPEPGWGLMDYLSTSNLDLWLADKTLLPTRQTQCAIPAGIFNKAQGAIVRGIAYGQELNLAHPPRPLDKKVAWAPDWTAKVRVKSVALLPLGDKAVPARKRAPAPGTPGSGAERPDDGTEQKGLLPVVPGLPGIPGLGEALKGLFGR
jgi:hypothetical protein